MGEFAKEFDDAKVIINGKEFTGNEIPQVSDEEKREILQNVNNQVSQLLGNISTNLTKTFEGLQMNVSPLNGNSQPEPTQFQHLIPRIESSSDNGHLKMTLNGEPLVDINLGSILSKVNDSSKKE